MSGDISESNNIPWALHAYTQRHPLKDAQSLINFWREAIKYKKLYPDLREDIAYWVVCKGTHSPLTDDNDIYEAVHAEFGGLEMPYGDDEAQWRHVEMLVDTAELELHEKDEARAGTV